MATPTKTEIIEKALELWHKENMIHGTKTVINPTVEELKEGGYYQTAQQILMCSNPYKIVIEQRKSEKKEIETSKFQFDLEQLLRSGAFICGQSGTGKSDLAMYVADRLMQKGIIVYAVDPSQHWLECSNVPQAATVENASQTVTIQHVSTVYDTSRLYVSEQRRFIEKFVETLYQFQIRQPKELRKWRIVVLEESQLVYPNGSFRSDKKSSSLQLVSVGRNFKLRFIAVTPFSANIDKYLVKMTSQRWFGSTSELNDLKYLKGFLGEQVYQLTTLDNGQFVYHYPKKRKVERIYVKPHKRLVKLNVLRISQRVFPEPTKPKVQKINESAKASLISLATALIFLLALVIAVQGAI